MAHTKFQYATKLPVVVFDMFRQRVMDFHFSGLGDVMIYLMEGYCRMHDGKKVSKTMKKVLSHQYIEYSPFFRYSDKVMFSFETSRELAGRMSVISKAEGYMTRNQLTNQIIGSFVASAHVTIRMLSAEMNSLAEVSEIKGTTIATYVSNYQYVFLKELAKQSRISLMGLLNNAADILLQLDNRDSGYYIPDSLRQISESVLAIKGSTIKEFRKGKAVAISVDGGKVDRIFCFMRKHQLNSPREFLRRVVLFFLEARYLIYKNEVYCNDDDLPEYEEKDYDDFLNEQYAKKDFARSIYV